MASAKALEAATAVNSLLQLSPSDRNACLAVIQEFLTSLDDLPDDDTSLDGHENSDPETEFDAPHCEPGTLTHTHNHIAHSMYEN